MIPKFVSERAASAYELRNRTTSRMTSGAAAQFGEFDAMSSPPPSSPLTFAVGDIHGCLDKLERLVATCEAHAGGRPVRYVFLGDYVDRGPDSRGVVEFLMRRQRAQPGTVVCLMGNHEQMAIMAHDSDRAMPIWLQNSGATTQRSYGRTDGRISDAHLAWL